MHSLVVAFLEQRLNPTVVTLHSSHAVQMSEHAGNHTRHTGNTLEEDVPGEVLLLCHAVLASCLDRIFFCQHLRFIVSVAAGKIKSPPQDADSGQGNFVSPITRLAMVYLDTLHLIFCIQRMLPCCVCLSNAGCFGLWKEIADLTPRRGVELSRRGELLVYGDCGGSE